MKRRSVILLAAIAVFTSRCVIGGQETAGGPPLSQELAATPATASISIEKTTWLVDGGSILNVLCFPEGRLYNLSLDYPWDEATYISWSQKIHFTIYVPGEERPYRETLEHGSAGERRLIELLDALITTTQDPHEKKNATSLVRFLKNRNQKFPSGSKWWDFTPFGPKPTAEESVAAHIKLAQLYIDDARDRLRLREASQNTDTLRSMRRRVDSLNKSLSELKRTDPKAEKRANEIAGEVESLIMRLMKSDRKK